MKKTLKLLMSLLLTASVTMAQTGEVKTISLDQAYQMALQNRYDIKANAVNEELAENSITKSRKEWVPMITANGEVRYNTQLQTMVFDGFGGVGQTQKIQIGTKNLSVFTLDLTQPIVKPGLNTDIQIAQNNLLLEQEKNKGKEQSIKQQVAEAYLNVLLKDILYKNAEAAYKRNMLYTEVAEGKYHLHNILENDLIKARLDLKNAEQTMLEARQNQELALMQLRFQLNVDKSATLVLTDSIYTMTAAKAINDTESIDRTELRQLMIQNTSYQLNLKKNKIYYIPTISLIANYTAQFQSEHYNYLAHHWTPYNYVGVKATLPITGNIKNKQNIVEQRMKLKQNELQLKQEQRSISNEVEKCRTELRNTTLAVETAKNNLALSGRLFESQFYLYKHGTVTYSSTLDSEASLSTAEQNYAKAVYNLLIARINYDKATGRL